MTLCAAIWNAWLRRGFPEILGGARMVRQPRLAFAGGSFVEAVEVRVAFDQRLLVLAHGLDEFVDDLVLDVGADRDDDVDGLHPGGLVDAGDVPRGVDPREVVFRAHFFHAPFGVWQPVDRQQPEPAYRSGDLGDFRRADGEEQQVEPAGLEVVRGPHHVHLGDFDHVVVGDAAGVEQRRGVRQDAGLLRPLGRDALAFQAADAVDAGILLHPERHLGAVQGDRRTQARLWLAFPVALALVRIAALP